MEYNFYVWQIVLFNIFKHISKKKRFLHQQNDCCDLNWENRQYFVEESTNNGSKVSVSVSAKWLKIFQSGWYSFEVTNLYCI